ncbi:MAG TPA: GWxTD domain-containing protein [Thermoanaerobaculia bacterium]|nr:GWxTD domain-containing protein [Thermoanaerobaculia bacterium]
MKTRPLVLAIVAAAGFSLSSHALSTEHIEWGRGPAQYLMTAEETARWKTVATDDEAQRFIALFAARRDPTPGTPQNEFVDEYARRVVEADRTFSIGNRVKGSMTDRGRALILFGAPKTVLRSRGQNTTTLGDNDERQGTVWMQWVYEDDPSVKEVFGTPRAQIRFVDRFGTGEYKLERGTLNVEAAEQRAIARMVTQPALTEAALLAAVLPPPPALPVELTTESLRAAVNDFKAAAKNPYEKRAFATSGQYLTAAGETFVPVMLYVPKSAGLPSQDLTFFGVLQDEGGKNVAVFETPAKLAATRDDFYIDHSLRGVPAGKLRGFFGVAQNGKPLAIATSDIEVAASVDPSAPATSPLILSNNVYPLTAAQPPDAPFTFGGVKVIPKADKTFRRTDELWYFVELVNPGVTELLAGGSAPKVQVRIDVQGPKKMLAPPREVEATPMKGVPGHYGVGSAIPLASFPPGEYTFTLKVIDTVRKASYTLSDRFRVAD